MLTIRRMQQMMAVAQERSFTRAATVLGMTQPALSRAIALLEADAGLTLFERLPTGVALTAAGEELTQEARRVLGSVALIEHNVRLRSGGDIGRVSFALGPLAASFMLKRILADTLAVTPRLTISATIRETSAIVDGVLEGVFDFGICSANTLRCGTDIDTIPLVRLPMGIFVRSGHPLLGLERDLEWDDLLPYPRITGPYPHTRQSNDGRLFGPLDTTVECNDFEILAATTKITNAIWLSAEALMDVGDFDDSLVALNPRPFHEFPVAEIVLLRQTDRLLSPASERIIGIAKSAATSLSP